MYLLSHVIFALLVFSDWVRLVRVDGSLYLYVPFLHSADVAISTYITINARILTLKR